MGCLRAALDWDLKRASVLPCPELCLIWQNRGLCVQAVWGAQFVDSNGDYAGGLRHLAKSACLDVNNYKARLPVRLHPI